jgi:glucose/arabinose dehydrogenase
VIRSGKSGVEDSVVGGGQGATGGPSGKAGAGKAARKGVRLVWMGSFTEPDHVTAPPGDTRRLFVVEKKGRIQVLVDGKRASRPFLDISGDVTDSGEQGLLSMAFAPDYSKSGRFYVDYTDRNGDTRVQQFRRSSSDPDRADPASRRQVLFVKQPFANHNGGLLVFGPDRRLYVGLGDGGSEGDPRGNGPDRNTLLAKILRIEPLPNGGYRSPASNPYAGRPGRDEIYAYGLRNPWRFSFDRRTGDLYIGDVGQNQYEEIDYARRGRGRGRDYGWSCWEGRHRYNASRHCPNPVRPVHEYSHSGGGCSITGGVVVRDPRLPALAGRYVYGDFCTGKLRSLRIRRGRATGDRTVGPKVSQLSSFGEDARGRVYVTSLDGPVYRLQAR